MELTNEQELSKIEEQDMDEGLVISHIPEILEDKGWSLDEFKGYCLIGGLSAHTAIRLANGRTEITVDTLAKVTKVLSKSSIAEVMELREE